MQMLLSTELLLPNPFFILLKKGLTLNLTQAWDLLWIAQAVLELTAILLPQFPMYLVNSQL